MSEQAKIKRRLNVFWPALVAAPAMKIGGSDSINSILSGHWRKFAEEAGISATALRARIRVLCGETLKQTCGTLSLPSECDRVLEIVKSRADKLIKTLA